jgi:hypothetical protein
MANLKVALLLRAKATNGNRPYVNPVMARNGKIRPLWAVYKNQPTHFPDCIYYLRYKQDKRLVFARTGSDLAVAQIELRRLINRLETKAVGNAVGEAEAPVSRFSLESAIQITYKQLVSSKRE